MRLGKRLRRLLTFLLIIGVGVVSLVATEAARAAGMATATASMAMMPDGSPCCPRDGSVMPGCLKSCPLMAICLAKCVPTASAGFVVAHRVMTLTSLRPRDDAAEAGPVSGPPARPPQA